MGEMIQMSTNVSELLQKFWALPPEVRAGVRDGLAGALLDVEGRVKSNARLKWRRGNAGLAGRLTSYAKLTSDLGIEAAIGFRNTRGFPYELAQEFGAKARGGGAMAIPVTPMARRHSDRGGSPRNLPGVKLIRLPNTHVLVETRKRAAPKVHYVLVKSIPPRLRFRETVASRRFWIERGILDGARRGARRVGANPQ